ncbi:hypothetical protein HK407_04g06900 [Ordospora pajunii]|uniref:uncharacterized protein n=1 Tax=Ordospora pajunii TaxID=3039483 RepID=UPI0029527592|nr:uncharacterized protein HK407_04g06900 [Ordospora pajunii]KAH9411585.1 hypothetical protein HK407_04g06900 [Ordospora pajunii]
MESNTQAVVSAIKHAVKKLLCNPHTKGMVMKIKLYEILFDMALSGTARNEREIFYMAVNTFGSQKSLARLVSSIMHETGLSKTSLGIRNTLKGTFIGSIVLVKADTSDRASSVEKLCSQACSPQLIPDMSCVVDAFTLHPIVVVVEKDTILHRIAAVLSTEPYFNQILLVCGKGYPCRNTVALLNMLQKHSTAILGLFDFDPFGIHIYSVYKYGTKKSSSLRISSIQRIGIHAEHILSYNIHAADFMNLNQYDIAMISKLEKIDELASDALFIKQLGKKLEMEAFFSTYTHIIKSIISQKLKENFL